MPPTALPTAATTREALCAAIERELRADIPLARAMQLAVESWDGTTLTVTAPLAPNINDKGCAFGGSLAAVMTVAGWSLARIAVEAAGLAADIYVQDSTIRYLAPVWADFRAEARLERSDSLDAFLHALRTRGKARLAVEVDVAGASGGAATTLAARFVALARGVPTLAGGDAAQSTATRAT